MEITKTEYYFSKKALFAFFIILVIFTSGFIAAFLKIHKKNNPLAFILLLPLFVIVIVLPKYIRYTYLAITNRPALILTKESLINNMSGNVYHWSQIKSISYEYNTGYKAGSGGYILVVMQGQEITFEIAYNSIKCTANELLHELQKYHESNKANNIIATS